MSEVSSCAPHTATVLVWLSHGGNHLTALFRCELSQKRRAFQGRLCLRRGSARQWKVCSQAPGLPEPSTFLGKGGQRVGPATESGGFCIIYRAA